MGGLKRLHENEHQRMSIRRTIGVTFLSLLIWSCGHRQDDIDTVSETLTPDSIRVLSILGRWWMPLHGNGDYMTTIDPAELHGQPDVDFDGQMFYLPRNPEGGTSPFYRLYSSTAKDHMDSNNPTEGGYTAEYVHGAPFNTQLAGTCVLRRWFKPYPVFAHALGLCSEDMSGAGYIRENTYGYGYRRYGRECFVPLTIRGAELTLEANKAAGGAISSLMWKKDPDNEIEFVNQYDYGRLIQIAFNLSKTDLSAAPTEGGDQYGCPFNQGNAVDGSWAHGSPLLSYAVAGKTLVTTTAPLLWVPDDFNGGPANPVMYKGTISKQVQIDFAGMTNVIRWTTAIQLVEKTPYLMAQVPTGYHTHAFHTFFTYDAVSDSTVDVTSKVTGNSGGYGPCHESAPIAGGIIQATSANDDAPAIGVYRRDMAQTQIFTLCDYAHGSTGGVLGNHTPRWDLREAFENGKPAGTYTWVSYLVVGTKADVRSKMRALYVAGY